MGDRMETTALEPISDKETSEISFKALSILKDAENLEIQDKFGVEYGTALLADIARIKKGAEDRRNFFVRPLNQHVKMINDLFKRILAPIEKADQILRSKIMAHRQQEQQRIQEELEKEARRKAELEAEGYPASEMVIAKVQDPPKTVRVEGIGATTARKVWDFEIEDESQIPRPYLSVSEQAIRAAIKSGMRSIPGVRIFEKEILSVRV